MAHALPGADSGRMGKRVVILGAGTAGTLLANRLRRELPHDDLITVVDRDGQHLYQPGLLFVPFGQVRADTLVRSRVRQLHLGIGYHQSGADRDPEAEARCLDSQHSKDVEGCGSKHLTGDEEPD